MEAGEILQLLDSHWFENNLFTLKQDDQYQESTVSFMQNPSNFNVSPQPRPALQVRWFSDQGLVVPVIHDASFSEELQSSPVSVILKPKLQKIYSGKEVTGFSKDEAVEAKQRETRLRRKGRSKSLSELEIEELKGFMELGFVFTEEDKRCSSLVSIIPGLQHWGEMGGVDEDIGGTVSRPYLSEAWGVLNQSKGCNSLMKWEIPGAIHDEINMKDQLRVWAQHVASTVKRS